MVPSADHPQHYGEQSEYSLLWGPSVVCVGAHYATLVVGVIHECFEHGALRPWSMVDKASAPSESLIVGEFWLIAVCVGRHVASVPQVRCTRIETCQHRVALTCSSLEPPVNDRLPRHRPGT